MTADYRCSFCGTHQDDVGRLIAGQRVFICDRCARTCAASDTGHGPDARCSFCGKRWDDVQWAVQGQREVIICAECVWLVIQILDEAPPSGPTARQSAHALKAVHRRLAEGRSWRRWLRWPWRHPHMDKATRL